MVIPVYKEVPTQEEMQAINNLERHYSKRNIVFVCPASIKADVYTVGGFGKETFPDRFFTSERAYSKLLLRSDFYDRFLKRGYTHILIAQTDVWMIGNEQDVYNLLLSEESQGNHWSYYGAPWPGGRWVYSKAFRGLSLVKKLYHGRVLYSGNGGFSLRNLEDTKKLLKEKWWTTFRWNSGEDVFYAYHGTANHCGFTVAPAQISRFLSLEENAKESVESGFIPIGLHAWKKFYPDFLLTKAGTLTPGDHRDMGKGRYPVPIVLFVFNRPKAAQQLAGIIARIHPSKVYLFADHARSEVPGETERVASSVKAVRDQLPNDCEVILDEAKQNMGCDARIMDGLSKVFAQEEMAVVLEDDCMPDLSFFEFVQELLKRYKNEKQVKFIAGSNQIDTFKVPDSYGFTYNAWTWGWASWARTWNEILPEGALWSEYRREIRKLKMLSFKERREFRRTLHRYIKKGQIPWDYLFGLSVMSQKGLSIVPATNLVINRGFGENATHTGTGIPGYYPQTVEMHFPLQHPKEIKELRGYHRHAYKWHRETLFHKLVSPAFYKRFLKRIFKK